MLINFYLIILIIFEDDTDNKQHIIHPKQRTTEAKRHAIKNKTVDSEKSLIAHFLAQYVRRLHCANTSRKLYLFLLLSILTGVIWTHLTYLTQWHYYDNGSNKEKLFANN